MTEIWYRADKWSFLPSPIRPVEIAEQTPCFVKEVERRLSGDTRTRRIARSSRHHAYFATYAEAREWLIADAKQSVEWAQQDLSRKQANLAELLALPAEPPKEG